jgi:transposase
MSASTTLDVGMAVPKASMAVAYVASDHDAQGIDLGTMGTRPAASDHLIRHLHAKATPLVVVYAAGPCGSWLSRYRRQTGDVCWVVAPALIPKTAGDRVKTDRRAAVPWARFMRAGELTPVDVPTVDDEALRARWRARDEAVADRKAAKCRLTAFVRRHDIRDTGPATWGPAHLRWLSDVVCPTPTPHRVFHAYVRAVTAHTARLQRLEHARQAHGKAWRVHPGVAALQAWRGVPLTVAVTTVAARGDVTRVEHPRPLMKSLGLIPSEDSPGERRRQGAMTTAGHPQARRALGEGAWASRDPAHVSRP